MIAGLSCVPVVDYCVWLPGDDRCIGTVTGRLHNFGEFIGVLAIGVDAVTLVR